MVDQAPSAEQVSSVFQVRLDIAELKGMFSQVIQDHGRRIEEVTKSTDSLRTDLTAVKDNGNRAISETNTAVTQNTSAIADIRGDVADVKSKQDNALAKTAQIFGPIIAIAALIWAIVGK